ncbi:MAG: helix-turn-helix domain-containing protein [Caldilinea sp.]
MIEGRQVWAARALLGWSREALSQASQVSVSVIGRLENGEADCRASTWRRVLSTLRGQGIEFMNGEDGSIGVRLRRLSPQEPAK